MAEPKGGKINFKTGVGHHKPPYGNVEYADPVNHKYPLDKKHIDAAVEYFNHPEEREKGDYSVGQWATMGRRVASAANRLIGPGHKFSGGKVTRESQDDHIKRALASAKKAG